MSNQFSIKNLSAEAIFQRLDAMDNSENKTDGLIQKSIWDAFASLASGRGVTKAMGHDRGIISINEYLKRGNKNPEIKEKMCEFLNNENSAEIQSKEATVDVSKQNTVKTDKPAVSNQATVTATTQSNTTVEQLNKDDYYTTAKGRIKLTDSKKAEIRQKYPKQCAMIDKIADKGTDVEYFAEKVAIYSKKYDVPESVLIAILKKECNFLTDAKDRMEKKNKCTISSNGPMQVEPVTVRDFFPSAKGNRFNSYNALDPELLRDILYDENGNLKYKSAHDLWKACDSDDDLGIMVGILCYKAKHALAIQSVIDGERATNLKRAANDVPIKWNDLTTEQRREAMRKTFLRYNNSTKYANDALNYYETVGGIYGNVSTLFRPDSSINPYENENACTLRNPDENL